MSLPWLEDDFKESSKSRSRSPLAKKEAQVDKPVIPVPQRSPRKSRSRSSSFRKRNYRSSGGRRSSRHSDDSSHDRQSRKSRDRNSRHSRRKRRGSSSSRSSSSYSSSSSSSRSSPVPSRMIVSMKSKYLRARLHVANIVSKDITSDDLVKHFQVYGNVVDTLLHVKNYAFIQFAKEEHARLAVEGERGRTFRGVELAVNLATKPHFLVKDAKEKGRASRDREEPARELRKRRREQGFVDTVNRRRSPPGGGPYPPPHYEDPYPPHPRGPFPPHHDGPYPPSRGGPFPPHHDGPYPPPRGGPFPPPHHRDPFPPHHREPGPDSFRERRRRRPYGPGPGDFGDMRPPYFEEPYGRPAPWMGDGPYRPPEFEEPFREPFGPHPPAECEIFVMNPSLRPFGEYVEEQIKKFSIITAVSIKPPQIRAIQLLEDLRARKALFAILINNQNEQHKSLTLSVLHGTPQEHRNMPIEDAVNFILDSFHKYVAGLKEKAGARKGAPVPPPPREKAPGAFLPAPPGVAYLLNLLADSQSLTVEELDDIIQYLTKRRDKLVDPKSHKLVAEENYLKSSKGGRDSPDRSLESRHRSPGSHRRSPESYRKSPENHPKSSEIYRKSPESYRRSPESYRKSPENHPKSSEIRHRSPEVKRRSLVEEGYRRSPHSNRRSPESQRRSPGSYRKSPPLDFDDVSQSPKAERPTATKKPMLLTEDLTSKIINILNSVRSAQNLPAAGGAQQQQPNFPTGVSTAAPPAQAPPPLPPPPTLPPLPPNEFDNFKSSGAPGSGDGTSTNSSRLLQSFLDMVKGGSSTPATSQQKGASTFPSGSEAGNQYQQDPYQQDPYQQDAGEWRMGSQDGYGYVNEVGPEQGSQGSAAQSNQETYGYPDRLSQMGNYGPPRY